MVASKSEYWRSRRRANRELFKPIKLQLNSNWRKLKLFTELRYQRSTLSKLLNNLVGSYSMWLLPQGHGYSIPKVIMVCSSRFWTPQAMKLVLENLDLSIEANISHVVRSCWRFLRMFKIHFIADADRSEAVMIILTGAQSMVWNLNLLLSPTHRSIRKFETNCFLLQKTLLNRQIACVESGN